ncbi:DUF6624 domain-containing protein [Salinimicrobium sp. WS361]|uniref:DUF6624 domain-containing protein n=1 Tax=Salinimicrobium sp. WS361 TaxID=3425123 RepID=UPI003D6F2820
MKKIPLLILSSFLLLSSCNKEAPGYNELLSEARQYYKAGEYENSGRKFSRAFALADDRDSLLHHYEAARAWSLAQEKDSAFAQLFMISEEGKYSDLGQISTDTKFSNLRTDERWIKVLTRVSDNQKEALAFVPGVISTLDTVYRDDQHLRRQTAGIQEKYGHDSEELHAHWELINQKDSVNLLKVEKILNEHGWLGPDLIGRDGNSALFLVIQHADLQTQEKYIPLLQEAVKKGNAAPRDLALMEDRVALRQGKKQIYGSQISRDPETGKYYVSPLQDSDSVDRRRAEVGLQPLQDYVSGWDITWDVETYKKELPKLEAMERSKN